MAFPNQIGIIIIIEKSNEDNLNEIKIRDINGKYVSKQISCNEEIISLDLQNLIKGVYLIELHYVKGVTTKKIILL